MKSVNVKSVDPDVAGGGARAELRVRIRVSNVGKSTDSVWTVRAEIVPSKPQMEPYFLQLNNEDATEPILPGGSRLKNFAFGFSS